MTHAQRPIKIVLIRRFERADLHPDNTRFELSSGHERMLFTRRETGLQDCVIDLVSPVDILRI